MNTKIVATIGIITLLVLGGIFWSATKTSGPGPLDTFAQCLGEKDVIFYGAFWCPHCQNQKKIFGNSAKLLPYVECSTPNGQGQTEQCKDAGIVSYPTWQFADGTRESKELSLTELSLKSSCPLPEATL